MLLSLKSHLIKVICVCKYSIWLILLLCYVEVQIYFISFHFIHVNAETLKQGLKKGTSQNAAALLSQQKKSAGGMNWMTWRTIESLNELDKIEWRGGRKKEIFFFRALS